MAHALCSALKRSDIFVPADLGRATAPRGGDGTVTFCSCGMSSDIERRRRGFATISRESSTSVGDDAVDFRSQPPIERKRESDRRGRAAPR
mmetsp:Transcript_6789/g.11354  ORF Transcript_6789/g.11354 Transcript_6789/m.11354 type:complete len:91 (-) Transcript_6789:11-283(-)